MDTLKLKKNMKNTLKPILFSPNKNLEFVFEIICKTLVKVDGSSIYLKDNESTDKYSNVNVVFPSEIIWIAY